MLVLHFTKSDFCNIEDLEMRNRLLVLLNCQHHRDPTWSVSLNIGIHFLDTPLTNYLHRIHTCALDAVRYSVEEIKIRNDRYPVLCSQFHLHVARAICIHRAIAQSHRPSSFWSISIHRSVTARRTNIVVHLPPTHAYPSASQSRVEPLPANSQPPSN